MVKIGASNSERHGIVKWPKEYYVDAIDIQDSLNAVDYVLFLQKGNDRDTLVGPTRVVCPTRL